MFGLEYTVFRPHNVYGEHQNIGDRYRNVIGIFMNQVMSGEPMTIFGDGSQSRAFSHIDEVAPIIARSATEPAAANEVFNVGADEPTTVRRLAEMVAAAFDTRPLIQTVPARNEVQHAFASHAKARSVFGRTEAIPLEVGLQRMAAWAREQGPRKTAVFDAVEISKNFPQAWAELVKPGE
jgi:UDP-glucose 4-epimerase